MALIAENYFERSNTFIRFLLVGIVNTCIGISVIFLLLNMAGLSYWTSSFLGNGLGALASYTLNKKFTFKSKVNNKRGLSLFILIALGTYVISYHLGYRIIQESNYLDFGLYKEEISVLLSAGIYTILNYLGQRYLTFKQ